MISGLSPIKLHTRDYISLDNESLPNKEALALGYVHVELQMILGHDQFQDYEAQKERPSRNIYR